MLGMGKKKPALPAETGSLTTMSQPSWLQGEMPQPPKKKKVRTDSGGQLVKGSMRAA